MGTIPASELEKIKTWYYEDKLPAIGIAKLPPSLLDNFSSPTFEKNFQATKKGIMPHGLIHVRYCDKKLLHVILDWIQEYGDMYEKG